MSRNIVPIEFTFKKKPLRVFKDAYGAIFILFYDLYSLCHHSKDPRPGRADYDRIHSIYYPEIFNMFIEAKNVYRPSTFLDHIDAQMYMKYYPEGEDFQNFINEVVIPMLNGELFENISPEQSVFGLDEYQCPGTEETEDKQIQVNTPCTINISSQGVSVHV